ncbi:outer membrane receptor for Fe3+-dicitrate [Terriglobus roseus DSM 18391]|uniref:Outer membrane receptor for Fe3+-dicitrate n=1 Tax=Terriglobus roseus (strain DSM 18391 / NRRL B-41598 / KBS 63) TaxID=926566 RepID=I3ZMH6_TERRK|nr:TonB-dependent receptor [Terriglobus roseus]AFL90444.1 outer membrane receptor for Fe3+-dicitrate [Terriglobus roseus DSM 18391]
MRLAGTYSSTSCFRLAASLTLAASALTAGAQSTASGATLRGTVTDAKGAALQGAHLALHNSRNTVQRRAVSDASGSYSFSGIAPGTYELDTDAPGFATNVKDAVSISDSQSIDLAITLKVSDINEQVTVEADASNSIAAQLAPFDARLDARSARTEINNHYIENFLSPIADYSEIIQQAPGAFSINSNGVGLGDSKTYFRGFPDGNYDITFDGIPFNDTNSPTHHSWAFFPSQWIGGVDFDRSPGSASTVGPTPFGGSINLLSKPAQAVQNLRFGLSYGSFNTKLYDGNYTTGNFGPGKKANLSLNVHRMSSDGFQTYNYQQRVGGELKFQYKFSDTTVLTGFAGVLSLDTNTPNFKGPLRSQIATNGYNYLMNNDATSAAYYKYNFYHVPTDFEYVGFKKEFGKGWYLDTKPYTYSYNNKQNYANNQTGTINASCDTQVAATKTLAANYACGTDKLNSYRKYGTITQVSQVSRFGIFRVGTWYEWATTDRYQTPQNPRNLALSALPNFHEQFWTNTYQPFVEYEWHPTTKLTITGGAKNAHYTMDLKQYADNGRTVGPLGGAAFRRNFASYNSFLPSGDANYRIRENWSVYGQVATGSVIPPSSVFDTTGTVSVTPKPSNALTFQTGTVIKLRRVTLDMDYYHTHFQNAYTAIADPNVQTASQYVASGDSVSKGFEGQTNIALFRGFSFYVNGTVGSARYVSPTVNGVVNASRGLWVANTPADTESLGVTYQRRNLDLGMFNKRVGSMWNDNSTFNQVVPIDPFNTTSLHMNYTVRGGRLLDGSKIRLSFNNLFDSRGITSVTPATKGATFVPNAGDSLGLLPGRSVTVSFTMGLSPRGR